MPQRHLKPALSAAVAPGPDPTGGPVQPEPARAGAPSAPGGVPPHVLAALDPVALARLAELDPTGQSGLLVRVLRTFVGSLARLLDQFNQARAADDLQALRHVAHTLKSSSASVGAAQLSRLCSQIEQRCRDNQREGLPGLLDDMVRECRRMLDLLAPVLPSP